MTAKKAGRITARIATIVCSAAFVLIVYKVSHGERVSAFALFTVLLGGFWGDWRLYGGRKKGE
ncbi:MAG: hypothetical protein MJ062_05655 [Oscillospiraceae bacterium]|nr:hypothetical protein [Oscillospiraceae bacterium]